MAAVNARKGKFSVLKGSFAAEGIHEFLRDLSFGRGSTEPMRKPQLPTIVDTSKWNGKDAEVS
jgi:protein disulfide-isomerase A6